MEISAFVIREFRKSIKLSQEQFAEILGVSRRTIQNYESGNVEIPDSIQKLIRYEITTYWEKLSEKKLEENVEIGFVKFLDLFEEHELELIVNSFNPDDEIENTPNKSKMYSEILKEKDLRIQHLEEEVAFYREMIRGQMKNPEAENKQTGS